MRLYLCCLLVFIGYSAIAQTKEDSTSLIQMADKANEALYQNLDSARFLANEVIVNAKKKGIFNIEMDGYITIGYSYYYNYEFDRSYKHFEGGRVMALVADDIKVDSRLLHGMAMNLVQLSKFKEAINCYKKSLEIDLALNDSLGIPIGYGNIAIAYSYLGKMDSAIGMQKKAIEIRKKLKSGNIHHNYNNIGTYYHELGRYDRAIEYYLLSAESRKKQELYDLEAQTYANLSGLFSLLKDHKKSISYAQMAENIFVNEKLDRLLGKIYSLYGTEYLRVEDFEKASDYFKRAIEVHKLNQNASDLSIDLHNMACVLEEQKRFPQALSYFYKALELKTELQKESSIVVTEVNLGNLLSELGKNDSAEYFLLKSWNKAKDLGLMQEQKSAVEYLAIHYQKLGKFETALSYREKQIALNDSIFNENYTDKISNLYTAYETAQAKGDLLQQQLLNADLEAQKSVTELKIAQQNNLIILIAALISLLIFVGTFLFYRTRQNQKNDLAKIRIEEQQKGLAAVITAQEKERKRIAKDLHDGIVQQLAGLKLGFQKMFQNQESSESEKLVTILDNSAKELRELSHKMMPRSLSQLGLIPSIKDMLDNSLGHTTIDFQFEHFGIKDRFKETIELAIFRIAQELVANVIKHSQATKAHIQLVKSGNDLLLIVEDNGRGIISSKNNGIGLMNISSRLDTIRGKVNFEPSPGSGTLATVKIPIN